MAKVIQESQLESVVSSTWHGRLRGLYVGAAVGAVWSLVLFLVRQLVVEPIACRDLTTAADTCVNVTGVSGNIAAVLVAALGMYILVQRVQPRPLIVALGACVVLWGLAGYLDGFAWYTFFALGILFYAVAYGLFSMIARIPALLVSLIVATVVAVLVRIATALL